MSPAPASKEPKKQKLAKQNGDELERIKTIGRDLLASRASINNAPLLISIISNSLEDESASEQGLESLLFLQAFFIPLFKSDLSSSAVEKASRRLQRKRTEETAEDETEAKKDAEAVYTNWLKGLYNEYLQLLKKIVLFPTPSYLLRAAALDAIMELVRQEKQGRFQNDLYFSFMNSVISSRKLDEVVVNLLTSKYFMYKDICYFSYSNIGKIVNNFSKHAKGEEMPTDNEDGELSGNCLSLFMNNTLEILLKLPPPQEDSESPMEEIWVFSHGSQCNEETLCHSESKETSNLATEMKRVDMLYAGKFCTKQVRKKMSKAWLTFLRLPLTIDVYKRILVLLHKNVIPYLTNPLLLSDFLTRSYDIGGVISVMALSSLFVLMTRYSLEYPDFYDKLYALLEPYIFMAKYRSRFFELLDTCLKSPLLPAYLAAAFAKKLSRLTLSSPPSGSLVIIALIHNLLRRHPSINCLVHQEVKEEDTTNSPKLEKDNKENNVLSKPGVDPFIHGETNTAKCKALQSSLWEIDTLRIHYSPAVSRFVTSLESDLTVRAKTTEVNVKDFSSGSYNTIFSEEVKRRIKQVPLAFYKSVPSTLFPQRPTEGEGSLAAFPGWNFSVS